VGWVKRHKIWTGIIAFVVLGLIGSATGGNSNNKKDAADTTPAVSTSTTAAPASSAPATTSAPKTTAPATTSAPKTTAPAKTSAPVATASAAPKTATIEHSEDIQISSCATDEFGDAGAQVIVTNHSSKASNYMGTVAFVSKDGSTQIDTGFFAVDNLESGQTSTAQDVMSTHTAPAAGYVCKLVDLTRYAS
jgi:hypothetical protein